MIDLTQFLPGFFESFHLQHQVTQTLLWKQSLRFTWGSRHERILFVELEEEDTDWCIAMPKQVFFFCHSSGILTEEGTHNLHNMLSYHESTSYATALYWGLQRFNIYHHHYFQRPSFSLFPIFKFYIGQIFWNLECTRC